MIPNLFPLPEGITVLPNFLSQRDQIKFVETTRQIVSEAPLTAPKMWNGSKFKVKVTSCGSYGWFADERGYKYLTKHPLTQKPFPKMPKVFYDFAKKCAEEVLLVNYKPQTCLINYYQNETGRLGLHVDDTEEDLTSPIVTLSLGDSCVFVVGGLERKDKIQKIVLHSGDVVIMHRQGRMLYHGVEKLLPGTSKLLRTGGRLSLTFRKVK